MTNARPGCLLMALPKWLSGGGTSRAAIGVRVELPPLDMNTVHRQDLPALVRARRAGAAGLASLSRQPGLSTASEELAERLVAVVEGIFAVGGRLAEARAFLEVNGTEYVAREKADLELAMIGASPEDIRSHQRAMVAIDERVGLSSRVLEEIPALEARLLAAGAELEALHERLGAACEPEALVHELRAYHQSATVALGAFEQTWNMVEALGNPGAAG